MTPAPSAVARAQTSTQKTHPRKRTRKKACCRRAEQNALAAFRKRIENEVRVLLENTRGTLARKREILWRETIKSRELEQLYEAVVDDPVMRGTVFEARPKNLGKIPRSPEDVVRIMRNNVAACKEDITRFRVQITELETKKETLLVVLGTVCQTKNKSISS